MIKVEPNGKRLLFVVNASWFFFSHRLPIALAARKLGYEVHVATGDPNNARFKALGLHHHFVPISRSGKNIISDLKTLLLLTSLMHRVKPDIVHLVTIKPVLYGGIATRIIGVPAVVFAITGLGTLFVAKDIKSRLLVEAVKIVYKIGLGHKNKKVIFQNPVDAAALLQMGAIKPDDTVMIRGSGVCLAEYPVIPEPTGIAIVSLAARLVKDKGIVEFHNAAKILKERGVKARFWLIGAPDPGNPTTTTAEELANWEMDGGVELLGYREDISALFGRSNIVVLPSYYGEGLPKVLIEAAACGRAVITTDFPGCRDAIEPGVTGLLVPVRNSEALADAIEKLINDDVLRHGMGQAGHQLAAREFGIEKIVDAHMDVYKIIFDSRRRPIR